MGLYFYNTFQRQERELGLDVRGLMSRLEINYSLVLESFCQRLQCKHAVILFEASGLSRRELDLDGYACPIKYAPPESIIDTSGSSAGLSMVSAVQNASDDAVENEDDQPLMGLKSFPAVFCYPNQEPTMHWPSILQSRCNAPSSLPQVCLKRIILFCC
jgi:hypothetical protein